MSLSQPSNIYVCSADSEQLAGPGSFVSNLGGGVLNITSLELTEFQTYNLMPTFPPGSVISIRISNGANTWDVLVPIVDYSTYSSETDMVNALNASFVAYAVANPGEPYLPGLRQVGPPATSFWQILNKKLAYVYPGGYGWTATFQASSVYRTDIANAWLGVDLFFSSDPNAYWNKALTAAFAFPNYPKIVRTACFYVRSTVNASDSVTVRYGVLAADRTMLAKVPNNAVNMGDVILYQPTIPDPVSKAAVGSSLYEIGFQILDDRFVVMTDIPSNCPIHMSFRCQYERDGGGSSSSSSR